VLKSNSYLFYKSVYYTIVVSFVYLGDLVYVLLVLLNDVAVL
jgi:hypothetical protein